MVGNLRWWWPVLATVSSTIAAMPAAATPVVDEGDDNGTIVQTDAGPVRGTVKEEYRIFQGIPYAAPPVGVLRWQSPQPVAPWTEPRDATRPGSPCTQLPDPLTGGDAGAEDCLFLNVTTPNTARPDQPKPVMVWVHGAFFGGAAGSFFDPHRLAVGGDVVVVTFNYRLGVLGFFGYPGLAGAGGYGLEDQLAALRWVRRNAAAFGGDPDNVTLFGESAGGMSTCALLTSPPAAGLFDRAVIQSGSCLIDWPANGVQPGSPAVPTIWARASAVEEIGSVVAADLGCADPATAVACLRRVPATDLLAHPFSPAFNRPAFGHRVLPESPADALRHGRVHRLPVMAGNTRDEGRLFAAIFFDQPMSEQRYHNLLAGAFADQAEQVAGAYPATAYDSPGLAWAAVLTDRVWVCPTLAANRLFAEQAPTYAYEFADRAAPATIPDLPPDFPLGAYHSSELAYLFDYVGDDTRLTPAQQPLSDQMIRHWANFAATGDPNGPDLPAWPRFDNADPTPYVQSLAPGTDGIGLVALATEHRCDFWSALAAAG